MTQFEFFMAFYGLLLGLALAELLLGFSNLLRQRTRPKLGALTLLLGIIVLLQVMAVFIGAWVHLTEVQIAMDRLALPTIIGILLFVICVITVPRDAGEWTHLDDYFLANRRWSIGLLIAMNALILGYEIPSLPPHHYLAYVFLNLTAFALMAAILLLRRRTAIATAMVALIILFVTSYSPYSIYRPLLWLTS